jgi:hypothetical protein
LHRCSGDRQNISRFLDRQAAKEAQLYDATLLSIHPGKFFERIIEIDEVNVLRRKVQRFVERESVAAIALEGTMSSGIIHQDLPHKLRCHCEKVLPILELNGTFDQPEIRFVYDRGALKRVIEALSLQVVVRYLAQFLVDQRHEQVKRGLVAFSPLS